MNDYKTMVVSGNAGDLIAVASEQDKSVSICFKPKGVDIEADVAYAHFTEDPDKIAVRVFADEFTEDATSEFSLSRKDYERATDDGTPWERLVVKLNQEQSRAKKILLALGAETVLEKAPAFYMREDILQVIQDNAFPAEDCETLLGESEVLWTLYRRLTGEPIDFAHVFNALCQVAETARKEKNT